jgi:hypothetical protein
VIIYEDAGIFLSKYQQNKHTSMEVFKINTPIIPFDRFNLTFIDLLLNREGFLK